MVRGPSASRSTAGSAMDYAVGAFKAINPNIELENVVPFLDEFSCHGPPGCSCPNNEPRSVGRVEDVDLLYCRHARSLSSIDVWSLYS